MAAAPQSHAGRVRADQSVVKVAYSWPAAEQRRGAAL